MLMPKNLHQLVNCDQKLAMKYYPQSPWAKSSLGGGPVDHRRLGGIQGRGLHGPFILTLTT